MKLGEVWREAIAAGQHAASAVADAGNGAIVFEGTASAVTDKNDQGFTVGQIDLKGTGSDQGDDLRISVKNENMACWRNGKVLATVPDLICLFDLDTGAPVANPDCGEGQKIGVVVLPAPSPFLTSRGLAVFGPKYAGINATFTSPLSAT